MRRLTDIQMAEASLQAMRNSRRLLDDSATLAAAGRLPSALMLAGLAADELGKHILISGFYAREGTEEDWKKFWSRFRNHTEKLGDALMGSWVGDLFTEEPPPSAKKFHLKRLAATYVDLGDNGEVRTPEQEVAQEDYDSAHELVERELRFCEGYLGRATPDQLAASFESMRTRALGGLAAAVDGLSAEGKMAFAVAMRSGMSSEEAMEFVRIAKSLSSGRPEGA